MEVPLHEFWLRVGERSLLREDTGGTVGLDSKRRLQRKGVKTHESYS